MMNEIFIFWNNKLDYSMAKLLLRHQIVATYLNNLKLPLSVFDAGAREGIISTLLSTSIKYTPSDLNCSSNLQAFIDLNQQLPFVSRQFDYSLCLDVLEHLNDPWFTFSELSRVSSKGVIISFPNMAYITFRLRFLLKGVISGKYSFNRNMLNDRHTWLTTYNEYSDFVFLHEPYFDILSYPIIPVRGRLKFFLSPLESLLSSGFPNLFQYGTVYVLRKY